MNNSKRQIAAQIKEILTTVTDATELTREKTRLRNESGLKLDKFAIVWDTIEQEYFEGKEEVKSSILRLLNGDRLDLPSIQWLNEKMIEKLKTVSSAQGMDFEIYLYLLIHAVGSLAKNGTKLKVCDTKDINFKVTPNSFGIVVAESSQGKTPLINTMLQDPLTTIQLEYKAKYELELEAWEERQAEAKEQKRRFTEKKPVMPVVFCNKYTGEAIARQVQRAPEYGIAIISDELKGLFNSSNQYRSGRGSDHEDLLSAFDGAGDAVMRAEEGLKDFISTKNISLFGGIQPEYFTDYMRKIARSDGDGKWARFDILDQPLKKALLPEWSNEPFEGKPLIELLADLYKQIIAFDAQEYQLSEDGYNLYRDFYYQIEEARTNRKYEQVIRTSIGKLKGKAAKRILQLHILKAALNKESQPNSIIDADTVKWGLEFSQYLFQKAINRWFRTATMPNTAVHLKKIIDVALSRDERSEYGEYTITVRDAYRKFSSSKRPSAEETLHMFEELVSLGFGEIILTENQKRPCFRLTRLDGVIKTPEERAADPGYQINDSATLEDVGKLVKSYEYSPEYLEECRLRNAVCEKYSETPCYWQRADGKPISEFMELERARKAQGEGDIVIEQAEGGAIATKEQEELSKELDAKIEAGGIDRPQIQTDEEIELESLLSAPTPPLDKLNLLVMYRYSDNFKVENQPGFAAIYALYDSLELRKQVQFLEGLDGTELGVKFTAEFDKFTERNKATD